MADGSFENLSYENVCALLTLTWQGIIPMKIFQYKNFYHTKAL